MKNMLAGTVVAAGALLTLGLSDRGSRAAGGGDPPSVSEFRAVETFDVERVVNASEASCDPAGDEQIRRLLQRKLPEIDLDAATAEHVLWYLRDLTGLNLRTNWTALEATAIERDAEVTIRLRDVTVAAFLTTFCDELGAGETEIAFEVLDGMLVLSTKEDLSRRTFIRIYDVKDMVKWSRAEQRELVEMVIESVNKYAGGSIIRDALVSGWRPFEEDCSLDVLIETIRQNIDPESWREAGGNVGSVSEFNNCLIVMQTNDAHRKLEQFLAALRKSRDRRALGIRP